MDKYRNSKNNILKNEASKNIYDKNIYPSPNTTNKMHSSKVFDFVNKVEKDYKDYKYDNKYDNKDDIVNKLKLENEELKKTIKTKDKVLQMKDKKINEQEKELNNLKSEIYILKGFKEEKKEVPTKKTLKFKSSSDLIHKDKFFNQGDSFNFGSLHSDLFHIGHNFNDNFNIINENDPYNNHNYNNEEELIDPLKEYEDHILDELCPNPDHMTYEQLLALQDKVGSVSKGVDKGKIKNLQTIKYNKKDKSQQMDKCAICQFEFKDNETLRKLKCRHYYHPECVDSWLLNDNSCPVCKEQAC